jgi:hypothetical protein
MTTTLAYYLQSICDEEKRFETLPPRVNVIKLFFFVVFALDY